MPKHVSLRLTIAVWKWRFVYLNQPPSLQNVWVGFSKNFRSNFHTDQDINRIPLFFRFFPTDTGGEVSFVSSWAIHRANTGMHCGPVADKLTQADTPKGCGTPSGSHKVSGVSEHTLCCARHSVSRSDSLCSAHKHTFCRLEDVIVFAVQQLFRCGVGWS